MIPARIAYFVGRAHKWLALVVGAQLVVWTLTGLVFTLFDIRQIRGEHLWRAPELQEIDLSTVRVQLPEALASVAEDRPRRASLRLLGQTPVWEIEAEIGAFLVSATTGEVVSPISEEQAMALARAAWRGEPGAAIATLHDPAPRESGIKGAAWAVRFPGEGEPVLYVRVADGRIGPARTDLWRTYDFLWGLHIMDYRERENFNHPLIIAAAVLAVTTSLFGVALLVHRFTPRRP
jgi:hypothetical protein